MAIQIREESWDRATAEMGGMDADTAADALRELGHDVELVDGDWGASYYADSDEEHSAVMALDATAND